MKSVSNFKYFINFYNNSYKLDFPPYPIKKVHKLQNFCVFLNEIKIFLFYNFGFKFQFDLTR